LRIGADESVLVVVDRSEMGQGVTTSLPMLARGRARGRLVEDPHRVRSGGQGLHQSDVRMQGTGGSTSVRAAFTPLRKAGAAAREMLVGAAADTWGVDKSTCRAERAP